MKKRWRLDRYIRPHEPDDILMSGCIIFAGRQINLNRLATQEGMNYSYIYRVFRGLRVPSMPYAIKLAACLGMELGDFLRALDEQKPKPDLGQMPAQQ